MSSRKTKTKRSNAVAAAPSPRLSRPPLLVDRREDDDGGPTRRPRYRSRELAQRLIPASLVQTVELPFADVAHAGHGPDGSVMVGYEIKTVNDALGRLSDGSFVTHQLPGLAKDYDVYWFVIEDQYRGNPESGRLEVLSWQGRKPTYRAAGGGGWTIAAFDGWLCDLALQAGIRLWRTRDRKETADWLVRQYWWWQKPWDAHNALKVFHDDRPMLYEPPAGACVAHKLARGMGWEKSMAAILHFGSIENMIAATEAEWREVVGIGKELACQIRTTITKQVRGVAKRRRRK